MARKPHVLTEPLPRPMDGERKADYVARIVADKRVKQAYDTPAKRMLAAERVWAQAKAQSLVSITTATDQFLLFGRLDR
jgi:hypothetical protein